MKIITTVEEIRNTCDTLCKQQNAIGFVPTMGYLHDGHLSLTKEARKENDIVVVSVFVNPLQFGVNEDFDKYPRDIERDQRLAKDAGADYFFCPTAEEMYPHEMVTTMHVTKINNVLCGAKRVGHFDGVVTILMKLFNIVKPDRVYMGTKDAQQVAVVQSLVDDYYLPVQIVPVETVREESGLALSSRNAYLTEEEKVQAPKIYATLQKAKQALEKGGQTVDEIIALVRSELDEINGEIDYIEVLQYPSMQEVTKQEGQIIIAVAVKFSSARLIDNMILYVRNMKILQGEA